MKKISATILLSLYIAFSSGVIINLHYCMDRVDSFQLGAAKSEICSKCGMHKTDSNGCCHDVIKIIKVDNDQQVSGLNYKFSSPAPEFVMYPVENTVIHTCSYSISGINQSPPISMQDTYLQNCVFRI